MSLTRKQMQEIVAFDLKRRTGLDFDGRRFGSITGAHAPHLTETWCLCHGSEVFKGKEKPARNREAGSPGSKRKTPGGAPPGAFCNYRCGFRKEDHSFFCSAMARA